MEAATVRETTRYLLDTTRTLARAREALEGQIALVHELRQENASLRQEIALVRQEIEELRAPPPMVGPALESPRHESPRGPKRRRPKPNN